MEPKFYEREVPQVIRDMAPWLLAFEEEGDEKETREAFADVYNGPTLDAFMDKVRRRDRTFDADDEMKDRKVKLLSTTLEFVTREMANEWFSDCVIWRSTKYDDYFCKTDLFMDIPMPDGTVRTLALDVTTSADAVALKRTKRQDEVDMGNFHCVEFYASELDSTADKGRAFVPSATVGASGFLVPSLARQYSEWRGRKEDAAESKEEAFDKLRYHPVGDQLYEEILYQVERMKDDFRAKLKRTETYKSTHRDKLKAYAAYLEDIRKALTVRRAELAKRRAVYERTHPAEPVNNPVRDAICNRLDRGEQE
jgi:hypothetical protein